MANSRQRVNDLFLNNWALKLLSLTLAALSFYAIRGATSFEIPYDIPLRIETEKGVAILKQDTQTVLVTFRGSKEDVRNLDQRQIAAVVQPTTTALAGRQILPITRRNVTGFHGVRVAKIVPDHVQITIDRETEETFLVSKPEQSGQPARGKVELSYAPKEVRIRGSRQRLKALIADGKASVDTEPVSVDGVVESFTTRVRVLPPPDTWVAAITPGEVRVKVSIVTETVSREMTNIAVLAVVDQGSPADVTFDPPVVNVLLSGGSAVLNAIPTNQVRVFVDCVNLTAATPRQRPVNVHLPSGIAVVATAVPETVTATMKKRELPASPPPTPVDPKPTTGAASNTAPEGEKTDHGE